MSAASKPHEMRLAGTRVIISPMLRPVPVLQTSPGFRWCSDTARAKHNAWLLARFGTTAPPALRLADGTLLVSAEAFESLRRAGL